MALMTHVSARADGDLSSSTTSNRECLFRIKFMTARQGRESTHLFAES
jgi:hypothetical protein